MDKNVIAQPAVAQLYKYIFIRPTVQLLLDGDNRTVGLLLCKAKDRIKAEYALRDISKPIGISDHELGQALPKDFHGSLPTIEEIERELESAEQE